MRLYIVFISLSILSCSNKQYKQNDSVSDIESVIVKKVSNEKEVVQKWDTIKGYFNYDEKEDVILSHYNKEEGKFSYKILLYVETSDVYKTVQSDSIDDEFSYLINEGDGDVFIYKKNKGSYGIRISCCASLREYEDYIYIYNKSTKQWDLSKSMAYTYRPEMSFKITPYIKNKDSTNYQKVLDSLLDEAKIKFKNKDFDWIEKEVNNLFLIGEIVHNIPITKKNINKFNDIAYFLEQTDKGNGLAVYLLKKITKEFPDRTIAYINLGDAYWGLGDKEKAKKAYKTYVEQMKKSGKETKIPKTILGRVK